MLLNQTKRHDALNKLKAEFEAQEEEVLLLLERVTEAKRLSLITCE